MAYTACTAETQIRASTANNPPKRMLYMLLSPPVSTPRTSLFLRTTARGCAFTDHGDCPRPPSTLDDPTAFPQRWVTSVTGGISPRQNWEASPTDIPFQKTLLYIPYDARPVHPLGVMPRSEYKSGVRNILFTERRIVLPLQVQIPSHHLHAVSKIFSSVAKAVDLS